MIGNSSSVSVRCARNSMIASTLLIALALSVVASTSAGPRDGDDGALGSDPPGNTVTLSKDEMPISDLVVGWIHMYAAKLEHHPEDAKYTLRGRYNLTTGYSDLVEASRQMNEAFNPRVLADRYRAAGIRLGSPADPVKEQRVRRGFASDRARFDGQVVGRLFDRLRVAGIDPVNLVELIRWDPNFGASRGYDNEEPDFAELRTNDAVFWRQVVAQAGSLSQNDRESEQQQ